MSTSATLSTLAGAESFAFLAAQATETGPRSAPPSQHGSASPVHEPPAPRHQPPASRPARRGLVERLATRGLPADVLTRKAGQGLGRLGRFLTTDPDYMKSVAPIEEAKCRPYDSVHEEAQKKLSGEIINLQKSVLALLALPLTSWVSAHGAFALHDIMPENGLHWLAIFAMGTAALATGFGTLVNSAFTFGEIRDIFHTRSTLMSTLSLFPQTPEELLQTLENDPTILDRFIANFEREENAAIQKWEAALAKARAAQASPTTTASGEAHVARTQKLAQLAQKLEGKIDAAKTLLTELLGRLRTEAGILHAQRAIADASIRIPDTEASLGSVLTDLVAYDSAMEELRELTGNG